MACPIHVYYCSVVLVTISDILSTIMSHVYLVTFSDICYTSCGDTLLMYTYILHLMYSFSCIPCRHFYYIITTVKYDFLHTSYLHVNIHHNTITTAIRLNNKYKVIKTYHMLLIHTDVIKNT